MLEPHLRFCALGAAANRVALDLCPLGVPAVFLDAAAHPDLVARYLDANRRAFPPPLELPGWVLVDCYLMPGAIGLLLDGDEIVAAYVAAPTVVPGTVVGVSLFCHRPGHGLGLRVKQLTLAMLRAEVQRGITQWSSPSLRTHTRVGPMRVEGPAPAAHGAAGTFVYRIELGAPPPEGETRRIARQDAAEAGIQWILDADPDTLLVM